MTNAEIYRMLLLSYCYAYEAMAYEKSVQAMQTSCLYCQSLAAALYQLGVIDHEHRQMLWDKARDRCREVIGAVGRR